MNIQEREELEFGRTSPYDYECQAVQQSGEQRPGSQFLLTDFDTWVVNPFWDGLTPMNFEEEE